MTTPDHFGALVPYPLDFVRRYRDTGLWGLRTIADEFHAVAVEHGDRDAVVAASDRMTFAELDRQSDLVAYGLAALGLEPEDPVLFQVTNRIEAVVAWYGVLKAGLIPTCSLAAHRRHEIEGIADRTGAVAHLVDARNAGFDLVGFATEVARDHPSLRHVVTIGAPADAPGVRLEDLGAGIDPAAARARVAEIQSAIDPNDVAVFQLSGGTTGVPKVIPRLHAEYWYNTREYAASLGFDATSRVGHLIPIIHNAGIVCGLHAPHSVGGCLVLTGPNLDEALSLLVAEGTTDVLFGHGHFGAVDRAEFGELASTLRTIVLSGTKVPPRVFERIEQLGLWSGQLFGMGEGFFAVTRPGAPREARLTTVGSPMSPLDEYRVLVPGTDDLVADGNVGELCCRGPYTIRGYFDAPSQNAVAFTADGFFRTGDLVAERVIEGTRFLSVEGRVKDLISRGGEKISAEEVELLLLRHPAIGEAAVVAMPDERLGERSCAYLVALDAPIDSALLRSHFEQLGVAKFKWPERIEWIAELPRTALNKVDKNALRADIEAKLRLESST